MPDAIATFFEAWQIEDSRIRYDNMTRSVIENVQYDDPRTPETINGIDALNDYVGLFSAHAPGWSAKVLASDTTGSLTRVTVVFSGKGADGMDAAQQWQYFVEKQGDLIFRMVGFVGTGTQQ